ncbi:MAG: glycosyltransferase family 4 protein [Candidatus Loosdrechtia sp.]|uniref:glycosyltransferase family 4 protein n=1 Tax=Candidatus Loosdrechtia sp. TaxID=3101272 RepID=UPI003A70B0F8|nr:MAG: glycosyltransferase family 1 protein [Candidatus Jettenia sp. AMX2]
MTNILINARFLTQPLTGVQRYALELVKAFDKLIDKGEFKGYKFELLAPPYKHLHKLELKNIGLRRVGFSSGYVWEQFELPFYAKKGLLFCPGNVAPLISLFSGQKVVVTVHSLSYHYFPEAYRLLFKLANRVIIPSVFKKADAVITVSQSERGSILTYYSGVKDRLFVVQHGTFSCKRQDGKASRYNSETVPSVLYVGSLSKGKNLDGVLNAARLLNKKGKVKFIIVGAYEKIFSHTEHDFAAAYVDFKGQINDTEELAKLYKVASCFVFPSFYESFGFPVLEAMSCGCPVVTSHTGSLPEICGDAALYCNPYDPCDIAEKIMQVLSDKALQKGLQQKGFNQARKFSWERCARETLAVIEKMLSG